MKKRIRLAGLLLTGLLLCGCNRRETSTVQKNQKEQQPEIIYAQPGQKLPNSNHYQLAFYNGNTSYILEKDTIYRIEQGEKVKIVEDKGIQTFGATDRYLFYFANSSRTDREEKFFSYDMQMKLGEALAFQGEEPLPVMADEEQAYIDMGEELLVFTSMENCDRKSLYQVFPEEDWWEYLGESKEEFATNLIENLPSYERYYLEWQNLHLFVFGRNKNEDYVFLREYENPLKLQNQGPEVLIAEEEDAPKEYEKEEGTFDGYDAYGNGYILKEGIRFFDRDCPYPLRQMEEKGGCVTWYQEGTDTTVSMILAGEYIKEHISESYSMTGGLDKGPCVGVYQGKAIYHCTVRVTVPEEKNTTETE